MGTGSSPVRRFLLFSELTEKSSLLHEPMPLKPSVSILPEVFQNLFRTVLLGKQKKQLAHLLNFDYGA